MRMLGCMLQESCAHRLRTSLCAIAVPMQGQADPVCIVSYSGQGIWSAPRARACTAAALAVQVPLCPLNNTLDSVLSALQLVDYVPLSHVTFKSRVRWMRHVAPILSQL